LVESHWNYGRIEISMSIAMSGRLDISVVWSISTSEPELLIAMCMFLAMFRDTDSVIHKFCRIGTSPDLNTPAMLSHHTPTCVRMPMKFLNDLSFDYPLVNIQKTMENHDFQWINQWTK
jgi:hypothetical protein